MSCKGERETGQTKVSDTGSKIPIALSCVNSFGQCLAQVQ